MHTFYRATFSAVALLLSGCAAEDLQVVPPEIHATLETPYGATSDRDPFPTLSHNNVDPEYWVLFRLDALSGYVRDRAADELTYYLVKSFTATLQVPGIELADSEYSSIGTDELSRAYVRRDPIIIPASAMGQRVTVHVEAADEYGTPANVLDFVVSLDP